MQSIEGADAVTSIFDDPVAYLASLGIGAELLAPVDEPLAPAAA